MRATILTCILVSGLLLLTVPANSRVSSHYSATSFVGKPILEGADGFAWNAQAEATVKDSYDLFPGEYFLFHTQFISAYQYASDSWYRYGMSGLFIGAALDLNGASIKHNFAVMPACKFGVVLLTRDVYYTYLYDNDLYYGPELEDSVELVGAGFLGIKILQPFSDIASFHADIYVGGMQGFASMVEAGANVILRDGLYLTVSGQALVTFPDEHIDYSEDDVLYSPSTSAYGAGAAWVMGFAGITYKF